MAEAKQEVEEARSAAEQAKQLLSQAEARAESAEEAKIELSIKLAELAAQHESAGDVSGMPTKNASESQLDGDSLQKRYAAASASLYACAHAMSSCLVQTSWLLSIGTAAGPVCPQNRPANKSLTSV